MNTDDLARAALDLVTQYGAVGTYTNVTPGKYVPGVGATDIEVTQSAKMVLLDLTLQSNGMSLKYGTQIKAGDKEAYMIPPVRSGGTAINVSPEADYLILGGVRYTVVTFKEINPTGSNPLVYMLYLRR